MSEAAEVSRATSHECHAPGCSRQVPPRLFACARHWRAVPKRLQATLWAVYQPGQEIAKNPSDAYMMVQQGLCAYLAVLDGRRDDAIRAWQAAKRWGARIPPDSAEAFFSQLRHEFAMLKPAGGSR